ncbi:unannotated protein [freshwater metagenome]|uniref:Unannotated protein n=1 Tax=freshwater metagenome TaxID=449393 RepID=A0A6J7FM70_9ZZZZ|nr:hypothetical protein [Actinomycetota bacterium]
MHYHGTPITPRSALYELAGRCFCVSFADPRDVDVCHEIGQSVMLDNGAFGAWTRGQRTDWPAYYEWSARWLDVPTTWAVIPDVIDGDEDANDQLIDEWPHGRRGAPVWHMHETLDRLARLVATWPLVCIGSSAMYAKLGTGPWTRRMAETMDVACDERGVPRTRLHMLRGLALSDGPYPFFSADSTNVARNHAAIPSRGKAATSPGAMAARIDALQPARRWARPARQDVMELVA